MRGVDRFNEDSGDDSESGTKIGLGLLLFPGLNCNGLSNDEDSEDLGGGSCS